MWMFPDHCVVCQRQGMSPCPPCAIRLPAAPNLPPPAGLQSLSAVVAYELGGRTLITALKYRNRRGALQWLAVELADRLAGDPIDLVTWVPASDAGMRRRGFDAGSLLADRVAAELGVPARKLLNRCPGPSQTLRAAPDRELGPQLSAHRRLQRSPPASVALIDDVCTTGASLATAAQVLHAAGVQHVVGAVGARTPPHAFAA